MADLMKFVQSELVAKKDFPDFGAGDTITVYYEIKEGEKTRTQFFKGVVIQRRGSGTTETFTIRKMSGAIGVERIFPVNLPALQKIEINNQRQKKIVYCLACIPITLHFEGYFFGNNQRYNYQIHFLKAHQYQFDNSIVFV
jgi:large subunit ribosomal protein L19